VKQAGDGRCAKIPADRDVHRTVSTRQRNRNDDGRGRPSYGSGGIVKQAEGRIRMPKSECRTKVQGAMFKVQSGRLETWLLNPSSAQLRNVKQATIQNIFETTLKPTKSPGFRPKITKMGRCGGKQRGRSSFLLLRFGGRLSPRPRLS
jgi:hypothetical protein